MSGRFVFQKIILLGMIALSEVADAAYYTVPACHGNFVSYCALWNSSTWTCSVVEKLYASYGGGSAAIAYDCNCNHPGGTYLVNTEWCSLQTTQDPPPDVPSNNSNTAMTCGSNIAVDNLGLGESVPIVGAPFSMVYWSDRVRSRSGDYRISVPVTSSSPDSLLTGVVVKFYLGITLIDTQTFGASADQVYHFIWDGLDSLSNPIQGTQEIKVEVEETFSDSRPTYPTKYLSRRGSWDVNNLGLGEGIYLVRIPVNQKIQNNRRLHYFRTRDFIHPRVR